MIKILRKSIFIILAIFSITFIVTCGKKDNLDKKEIIEKFIEASENTKSMDGTIDIKTEMELNGNKVVENISMDSSLILDPFMMKVEMQVPNHPKILGYLDEEFIYFLNPQNNKWYKQNMNDLFGKRFKTYITNTDPFYDVIKDNIDKIDIEEKNGNYIISISKESQIFKKAMEKQISSTNAIANSSSENETKIENMSAVYTVDKNTYLTTSSSMSYDLKIPGNGKMTIDVVCKMRNINKIENITIPEEAKNATTINNIKK